jgi:DNA polymerase/3'-5' exonuclease PolX
MPKVDFKKTDNLENIAGIGKLVLQDLNSGKLLGYKVHKLSDIHHNDLIKLPREAYLTIKHTRGDQYTRAEVEKVAHSFMKKVGLRAELVGSYRREKPMLNDIDLISTEYITINPSHGSSDDDSGDILIIRSGDTKVKLLYKYGNEHFPIDILFTPRERYPFALMHFTGSKEFNIHMSTHAQSMGYKLSVNGLYKKGILVPGIKSEKDIFAKLKLKYIPPKLREH